MNKIFASVGLAALGVSTLHAQYAPGVTPSEMANPRGWSVAATVRGFYDDNYLTRPNSTAISSYGEEFSPAVAFNSSLNNSLVTLSYVFDMQRYERTDTTDSSHQFNANLTQKFSDRYSLQVGESFVVAQQPTVIDTSIVSTPLYTSGDNIHNNGTLSFTAGLTPEFDLQLSYANDLYAYQQTYGDVYNPDMGASTVLSPSRSALLDRIDQLATVNLNWKAMNQLTAVLGYTYGHAGYTSPEPIIFANSASGQTFGNPANVLSKSRNNDSHFFFVGADKQFTSTLVGRIRAGGEYLDYYNADESAFSPYLDANLTWTYMKDCTLQAGVTHEHNATDVVSAMGQPVLDSESTAAYLSVSHKIAGALTGGLMGQFQHSAFNDSGANNQSEEFFITGLNFSYRFSQYLSAETGYNWNKLVSDISDRDYTRNVVYLGVRATY